jgi:hypothetical protein
VRAHPPPAAARHSRHATDVSLRLGRNACKPRHVARPPHPYLEAPSKDRVSVKLVNEARPAG